MEALFILIYVLLILAILLATVTVVGHAIWLIIAAVMKRITAQLQTPTASLPARNGHTLGLSPPLTPAGVLNEKPSENVTALLEDLAATGRQLDRFCCSGRIEFHVYDSLKEELQLERFRLLSNVAQRQPIASITSEPMVEALVTHPPASVVETEPSAPDVIPVPSVTVPFPDAEAIRTVSIPLSVVEINPAPASNTLDGHEPRKPQPVTRKSFTEVIGAFMEESNIRWGEIIGGLLIIGCSTALVVSLWAEISQVPVLKFLIFTTVTAALFGVGLYTEHRWKLPTTSRGILTIATLLVPLNFLAIAAVSSGTLPPDMLVIISELVAPALFLCLVYFAGRVLTPRWPHLLAAGVLGSSIGQLLVRHFAAADISPAMLFALGAFPILVYCGTSIWVMYRTVTQEDISEPATTSIFITLGAMTFAAALPFGLLLYKTGPIGMTMMYLAPLVSLGGIPALSIGTILWRRLSAKELVAQRTAGTTLALLGTFAVLLGMVLAWPNPASIVPAAILNFLVFSALAVWLEIPTASFIGSLCLALACLTTFHVLTGDVSWQNLRVTSLLKVTISASSGRALVPLFALFIGASEWLSKKGRAADSRSYLVSAALVAVVSVLLITILGLGIPGDPEGVSLVLGIYSLGAFWIGVRKTNSAFGWIGCSLLLGSIVTACAEAFEVAFPWQTALLVHATACAIAAIVSTRYERCGKAGITKALNYAALSGSFLVVLCLIQAGPWETTLMQAQRMLWLASIWLGLLWLNRRRSLFTIFQIALTFGVVYWIKGTLQQYEWYAYLPHAFLHPWSLQIQGTAVVLMCLGWTTVRLWAKRVSDPRISDARYLLDAPVAFDRLASWLIGASFLLLSIYGAWSGVAQELTSAEIETHVWNIAGFPHEQAFGPGSWILLGLLAVSMILNFRERKHNAYCLGALGALAAIGPLLAGQWGGSLSTASAWRWIAVILLLLTSFVLWFRKPLTDRFNVRRWFDHESLTQLLPQIRVTLLTSTLVPLLALTAYPALRAIYYKPVHGPSSGIFALLDNEILYGVPLVFAAFALIGFAIRERLPLHAFAGGLFFNLTATMIYLFSVVAANGSMNRVVLAHTVQLNAIVSAIYALIWLTTRSRWLSQLNPDQQSRADRVLGTQSLIALVLNVLLIGPVAIKLIARPDITGIGTFEVGRFRGWVAFVLAVVAAGWFGRTQRQRVTPAKLFGVLLSVGCLLSFGASRWDVGNWSGYHSLIISAVLSAWFMFLAMFLTRWAKRSESHAWLHRLGLHLSDDWEWDCGLFATVNVALVVFMTLRGRFGEPTTAWWSIIPLVVMTGLLAALHWHTLKRAYLYAAGTLFSVGSAIWWRMVSPSSHRGFEVVLVSLCVSSLLWLALELRARKHANSKANTLSSFHNVSSICSLAIVAFLVVVRLFFYVGSLGFPAPVTLDWLTLGSVAILLFACSWDKQAKYSVAGLYVTGLLMASLGFEQLGLSTEGMVWAGTITLSIAGVATSLAWCRRNDILRWTDRLSIPRRIEPTVTRLEWLTIFNVTAVALIVLSAYCLDLTSMDWSLRFTAALAVIAQGASFTMLAEDSGRAPWQRAAISIFLLGIVLLGWSTLTPLVTGTWLNRAVILMVTMFGSTALYSLSLKRGTGDTPEWTTAVRDCMPWVIGAGAIALMFTLSTEVFYQIAFDAVRINSIALVAIGVTLVSAIITLILFALYEHHDPLGLSERGRMKYVYAAEIMLALLVMHVRLTMPWLFTGFFDDYWPFVVIAIAYFGVITSEALRRRNLLVLSRPMERTGAFLPLLPVIGFWVAQSQVDYSVVLFLVGGVYGGLSILRRSFAFGLLAAVAGNGGLWYLLQRTDSYGFLQHPQLWLIPVALSILIAAHLNQKQFTEEQLIGVRYFSLLMIYASSTADIFLNGVADSPWLPLILAALSLCGIFAGISLRIRGLLLMGLMFLLLAIITMISYASVNLGWTWLWYVAGIVTGATIIFMFAVFEKKRGEVLRVVDGLKEWNS